jgi:hypothetical protein
LAEFTPERLEMRAAELVLYSRINQAFRRMKEYVGARIDLYRMPHDFSLWDGAEVWSRVQLNKIQVLKTEVWQAAVAVCPQPIFTPRVHRLFRHSAAYSTSRGCAPAPPKSTRLTSST